MKDVTRSSRNAKPERNWNFNPRWLYFVLLVLIALYYYIFLPPIHYASIDFWVFLLLITVGIVLIELIADGLGWVKKAWRQGKVQDSTHWSVHKDTGLPKAKKYKLLIYPWIGLLVIAGLSYVILSPVFFADKYANMIQIETKDFATDFPETDMSQVPLVDRDTAMRLGNRQLGAITDLVSQFEASDEYTQININSRPYRVTPLEYAGFFRWLNNFQQGIPHYLQVDNVTGEVKLQTPPQPIRYSKSELFNRDVLRRLRFSNPFTIFDDPSFEVDDDGNPYYIATTYTRRFGLREPEVTGVITLNAMTGETQYYDINSSPEWIDRVYSARLIMHQITMRGHYSNGFWNSLFAKKGVTEPTEGYNYLPIGDDLYLYTGITSVVADESNIGFVLVNLRTKEANMYPLTAAEEFSAMRSAEGSVQETNYTATFPLLVNIQGEPMYILTLKDNSGLIKEYALVDAQNYQDVYTASSVTQLMQNYAAANPVDQESLLEQADLQELSGSLDDIQAVVADGQTVYYFMVDGQVYQAPLKLNERLPFLTSGDSVDFKTTEDGQVVELEVKDELSEVE